MFIKTPPTFVEVLLGDSLTLSCGAHGNPRPTVVWHKDDSRIEKHEKIKVSWMADGICSILIKYLIISIFCRSSSFEVPLKQTALLSSPRRPHDLPQIFLFLFDPLYLRPPVRFSMAPCLWPPSQEIFQEYTNVTCPTQRGT